MSRFINCVQYLKCGYSRSNFPTVEFPSLVGRPIVRSGGRRGGVFAREQQQIPSLSDIVFGEEAEKHRNFLNLSHPMENGVVRNWDDMKALWQYAFGPAQMNINPKDHRILLTEAPMNSKANRERMVEVMLEEFGFKGVHVAVQAVLTLYAQGKWEKLIFSFERFVNWCCD